MKINTQEKIVELVRLKIENPNLEVIVMIGHEVVTDDSCNYWRGAISRIEKNIYCEINKKIYYDKDSLLNYLETEMYSSTDVYDTDIKKEVMKVYEVLDIKEVIYIFVDV